MLEHEGFELAEVAQAQEQVKHVAGHLVLRGKHGGEMEEEREAGQRAMWKRRAESSEEAPARGRVAGNHTRIGAKQAVAALSNSHCD